MEEMKQSPIIEAAKSTKEQVLDKFRKLENTIESLRAELAAVEAIINQCWWDGKACCRYVKLNGLRDAGPLCHGCLRLDLERVGYCVDRIIANFMQSKTDMAEEHAADETTEEAWQEVNRELDNLELEE